MGGNYNKQAFKRVTIKDEGVTLVANPDSIDFAGAGVTGSAVGNDVTETIPGVSGNTFVYSETPSGTINGSNTVFTIANTPVAGTVTVYKNGVRQKAGGEDYTISGDTVTFVSAPFTGSIILCDYQY